MSAYLVSTKDVLRASAGEIVPLLSGREEWKLPDDRIELGEFSIGCLVREIAEELNLHVGVGALVDIYLFEAVLSKHVFVTACVCALFGLFEPTVSHEYRRLGLFAPDALPVNLPVDYRVSIVAACNTTTPPD